VDDEPAVAAAQRGNAAAVARTPATWTLALKALPCPGPRSVHIWVSAVVDKYVVRAAEVGDRRRTVHLSRRLAFSGGEKTCSLFRWCAPFVLRCTPLRPVWSGYSRAKSLMLLWTLPLTRRMAAVRSRQHPPINHSFKPASAEPAYVRPRGSGVSSGGVQYACPRRIRSFHFAIFTPFRSSHRQNDDSPIRGGRRIAGTIRSANVGANSAAKQAMR
jgi:hypothetical protein